MIHSESVEPGRRTWTKPEEFKPRVGSPSLGRPILMSRSGDSQRSSSDLDFFRTSGRWQSPLARLTLAINEMGTIAIPTIVSSAIQNGLGDHLRLPSHRKLPCRQSLFKPQEFQGTNSLPIYPTPRSRENYFSILALLSRLKRYSRHIRRNQATIHRYCPRNKSSHGFRLTFMKDDGQTNRAQSR